MLLDSSMHQSLMYVYIYTYDLLKKAHGLDDVNVAASFMYLSFGNQLQACIK